MENLDLLLVALLGFSGSFGHCAGMCGPLATAFALSQQRDGADGRSQFTFHLALNAGRVVSYTAVGALLGALGSASLSGELAGIGSHLRQWVVLLTGLLLVWMGIVQIVPQWLPSLPVVHPIAGRWHERLGKLMNRLSLNDAWWTPLALGVVWGLIPCGFLYAAQIKAIETGSATAGAATMLAFGTGTAPVLLGIGAFVTRLSGDRRSQLFRLGGWITLAIGLLTLLRRDAMQDYTGHAALLLLALALAARPLKSLAPWLLSYRRAFGVGAFVLAVAHAARAVEHTLNWNFDAVTFMVASHRWGLWAGIVALLLIAPAALTSFDRAQQVLGKRWRQLHLLSVPALGLAVLHVIAIGSHYLGELAPTQIHWLRSGAVFALGTGVLVLRNGRFWRERQGDNPEGGDR